MARAIEQGGCKDVLLYLGGGGYASGSPAVNVGTRSRGRGRIEQQVVTVGDVRSMLRADRDVTFKLMIDAPHSGGFLPILRRESNLAFFASSSGDGEPAFTALEDVVDPQGRPVPNEYNQRGFLEFSNRMLSGLACFLSRPKEVAAATRAKAEGRTASFLSWTLGRAFSLCAEGSLGDRVEGAPKPTIHVDGGLPPAPPQRRPAADLDGDPLSYAVTAGPLRGGLTVLPGNGSQLIYTPTANANGVDLLAFMVSDGRRPSARRSSTPSRSTPRWRAARSRRDRSGGPGRPPVRPRDYRATPWTGLWAPLA